MTQQTHLQRAKEEAREYKEEHGDFYTALSDKQLDEIVTSTYLQAEKETEDKILNMIRFYHKDIWSDICDCLAINVEPHEFEEMTNEEYKSKLQSLKQTKD